MEIRRENLICSVFFSLLLLLGMENLIEKYLNITTVFFSVLTPCSFFLKLCACLKAKSGPPLSVKKSLHLGIEKCNVCPVTQSYPLFFSSFMGVFDRQKCILFNANFAIDRPCMCKLKLVCIAKFQISSFLLRENRVFVLRFLAF